jgi:hypothetical protein
MWNSNKMSRYDVVVSGLFMENSKYRVLAKNR